MSLAGEADRATRTVSTTTQIGDGWHVLVMSAEDRPSSAVLQKLPDAAHVAYVTLEPIGADSAAYILLEKVVRAVARAADGVWVDLDGSAHFHNEGKLP
jgi:hypothetical protein